MVSCSNKLIAINTPLIPIMITVMMTTMMIAVSAARELRPSVHGLEYQSTAPVGEKLPPEMEEFFGSLSSSASAAPTSRSGANVALPKAMNSNDTAWWNGIAGKNNGDHGDQLRHVLLVASVACGATGAALLVASGIVYFVKYKKRKATSSTTLGDNSKAIVISK
ncbi:uncharacterized protein LOC8265522 [Ricinus communis]|uniref:Transmembrane protein n=1 Tax=Ricinus communis TaxID=3988 RepID=B9SB29_RICCO|nr:uncharacterized protein LOC8265522 [Ricinus communis]EEF39220.1 conserved hypothetical protein [Ricinus communis]|eukprot:XP_002523189.1 uncharacterized protein LOC8265522 [Ricinus communis]